MIPPKNDETPVAFGGLPGLAYRLVAFVATSDFVPLHLPPWASEELGEWWLVLRLA